MNPTHLSLFAGIGGIDLAAEWAGFETVGQVEYAEYQNKVLKKHWPDVPRWKDVKDVTKESIIERCGRLPDLVTGGFPCQPHSLAGKRKASADERDLWGEFARIICEVNPRWVLAENVAGLRSSESGRFFGRVLRDLAEMGYNVGWGSWKASDVGAPHSRERIFIVAYAMQQRDRGGDNGNTTWCECTLQTQGSGCCNVAYANHTRGGAPGDGIDSSRKEDYKGRQQFAQHRSCRQGVMAHSDMQGCKRPELGGTPGEGTGTPRSIAKCACYHGTAGIAQPRLGGVPDGVPCGMDGCRWPAGIGDQHEWEPPRITSIKTNRAARLTALGNAVVPQQVYPILKEIRELL